MSQATGNARGAAPSHDAPGAQVKPQLSPQHVVMPVLTLTPSSEERLGKASTKQQPDIDKLHGAATIGLLTSESPDSVAAWRGQKRSWLYGKPILACNESSRVLVLSEPVYMMWPDWMQMDAIDTTISPTVSEVKMGESNHQPDSESVSKCQLQRRSRAPCPEEMRRVSRSSFKPSPAIM